MSEVEEFVGNVFVDAGLIWVGDPCYVMGDDATSRVKSYQKFMDDLQKANHDKKGSSQPLGAGVGIAVSSGFGDGSYPVYATISDEGVYGKRVKSIRIEFMEDDDNDLEYEEVA